MRNDAQALFNEKRATLIAQTYVDSATEVPDLFVSSEDFEFCRND